MKKLLFLLGCLLLLLAAAAAPASANEIQWQVIVGPHWSGDPLIFRVDKTAMTYEYEAAPGVPFDYVPADATDVVVGDVTGFVNRGNMQVFAKAYFQEMTVEDPLGNPVIDIDRTECHDLWGPLYHFNDLVSPDGPWLPYNPRIGAGMWAKDWLQPLPLNEDTKTLTPGWYKVTYDSMLRHRIADPMWPDRGKPGGEGYPPIGGPWGWGDSGGTLHFELK